MSDKKCSERIDDHYDNVMETLRILWAGYCNDECPTCDGTGIDEDLSDSTCETKCKVCGGEGKLSEDTPEY